MQLANESQVNRMNHDLLSLTGVRAGYGKKEVLCGATCRLAVGEIVAILGLNGAGKSTLLKVIAGVIPAWEGEITLRVRILGLYLRTAAERAA